jgi:Tfp pilus assembly protein PilO
MNLPNVSTNIKVAKGVDVSKITTYGAPLGAIAVSIIILLFIVWPKMTQALQMRAANEELASRVEALVAKVQLLSSLDKVQLDSQLGSSEQLLPSDKSVFTFVRQVEAAAGQNGVLLNKVDVAPGSLSGGDPQSAPAAGNISDPAPKVQVKVALTSDYRSFINFLTSIYSIARVVGIRDLTIATTTSAGGSSALRSSLVIDAYWKSLPTQLGSVESPIELLSTREEDVLKRAKAAEVSQTAPPAVVPSVPSGKSDLFAPF